jgi:hypothetical protein
MVDACGTAKGKSMVEISKYEMEQIAIDSLPVKASRIALGTWAMGGVEMGWIRRSRIYQNNP